MEIKKFYSDNDINEAMEDATKAKTKKRTGSKTSKKKNNIKNTDVKWERLNRGKL